MRQLQLTLVFVLWLCLSITPALAGTVASGGGGLGGGGGGSGDASEAEQQAQTAILTTIDAVLDTIAGHLDGVETLITSTNTKLDSLITGVSTTLAGYLDGVEGLLTDLDTALDAFSAKFMSAAALADGTSNPTTTGVAAYNMCFNGTTWDRCTGTSTLHYATSAASTNATNIKNAAGTVSTISVVNTTATVYYLRMYNLSSAPTCSSATGFVNTIPVPASTSGAGIVIPITVPHAFTTGIGYCLTGGGSSTDNTNAATGVYINIWYK